MSLALGKGLLGFGYNVTKAVIQNDLNQAAYYDRRRQARIQTRDRNTELLKASAARIAKVRRDNRNAANSFFALIDQGAEQVSYNAEWLRDVYRAEQLNMNEIMNSLAFKDQNEEIQLAKRSGIAAASGRTGVTAARLERQAAVQLGLNRAQAARRLTGQIDAFDMRNEQLQKKVEHDANMIGKRTSVIPELGRVPEMQALYQQPYIQKPSSTAMWTNIIESGLDFGMDMYSAMNPKA